MLPKMEPSYLEILAPTISLKDLEILGFLGLLGGLSEKGHVRAERA